MTILAPTTRALELFRWQLASAHTIARTQRVPFNPVQPDAVLTLDGQDYAVEWRGGGLSKTMEVTCTVTRHDTGRDFEFVLIRTERQSKAGCTRVRYSLKGQPAWASQAEASVGLVALAAPMLSGLNAYNPVTGPALLAVSEASIYRDAREGNLPHIRVGTSIRICETALGGYGAVAS